MNLNNFIYQLSFQSCSSYLAAAFELSFFDFSGSTKPDITPSKQTEYVASHVHKETIFSNDSEAKVESLLNE